MKNNNRQTPFKESERLEILNGLLNRISKVSKIPDTTRLMITGDLMFIMGTAPTPQEFHLAQKILIAMEAH